MAFHSILFERTEDRIADPTHEAPDYFVDLNLDQVINAIMVGKEQYNLKPFYYTPLRHIGAINYRHEVMRDLESKDLFSIMETFGQQMSALRDHLAQADKRYYKYQKERWFVEAVEIYCDAVNNLNHELARVELKSRGMLAFRDYVADYAISERFATQLAETKTLLADLSGLQYCLHIRGNSITVRRCESEIDYSADVEATFAKFKQGAVKDYKASFPSWPDMNHVEAQILDLVAQLYPELFVRLDEYCAKNTSFLDETIGVFDREIQFYLAYLEYIGAFRRAGLKMCYPIVTAQSKAIYGQEIYDMALASKLIAEKSPIICNDFYLEGQERIFIVSGPNQGGKTTFARTFGQMHYLARLGCLVAGGEAQLYLCDNIFTHFEKEEAVANLRGKLQDDLVRIHDILTQATPDSIVIINEIFTSTTLNDAVFLGKKVIERLVLLDLLCVCVTFIDELVSLSEKNVSMVSTIVPENPATRTFKIVRRPADGLSYAISIAEKYRVTYAGLKERIQR